VVVVNRKLRRLFTVGSQNLSAEALHKKSSKDAIDAALPPDVRRGSASPFKSGFQWGCALGPGLAPSFMGQRPNHGLSPKS
jgi:hypothetical protein